MIVHLEVRVAVCASARRIVRKCSGLKESNTDRASWHLVTEGCTVATVLVVAVFFHGSLFWPSSDILVIAGRNCTQSRVWVIFASILYNTRVLYIV